MRKYKVTEEHLVKITFEVEAVSEEEAIKKARDNFSWDEASDETYEFQTSSAEEFKDA